VAGWSLRHVSIGAVAFPGPPDRDDTVLLAQQHIRNPMRVTQRLHPTTSTGSNFHRTELHLYPIKKYRASQNPRESKLRTPLLHLPPIHCIKPANCPLVEGPTVREKGDFRTMTTCEPLDVDQQSVNTIRTLSMDAIQKANSGHPGAPMGLAAAGYVPSGPVSCGITPRIRTGLIETALSLRRSCFHAAL
jgi:hypothetical protein